MGKIVGHRSIANNLIEYKKIQHANLIRHSEKRSIGDKKDSAICNCQNLNKKLRSNISDS